MFPFNLFKKKEESDLPEIDSSMQDNLPVQRDFSSGSGFDKEDLILSKLVWYRESQSSRHLEDAESVIKISGKKLDFKYLRKRAKELGASAILTKIRSRKL